MPDLFRLGRPRRGRNDESGFTLVELLVVVVIIGVLIAIAIPLYLNYTDNASDKGAMSDVRNAVGILESCKADKNGYPSSLPFATAATNSCAQSLTTTAGTTFTYRVKSDYTSYNLFATSTKGTVKAGTAYYCYSSAAGGSVVKKTGSVPSTYNDNC